MYKVLTLNKISETGLAVLGKDFAVTDKEAAPDAIILRSFAMHDMELPESLLAVARAGAGVNNIPIDKCTDAGVVVFNTPGANANAVKELVIAGLMLISRKIWQGINWAQGLKGQEGVPALVEKGKGSFGGGEIIGKTLGIVGVGGAIGVLVANACHALGMKVIGYDPFISEKAKAKLAPEITVTGNLGDVFADSDYITVHVPYNNETKHMINAAALKQCKKGVAVLNFARGELVNDADIKTALADGQVSVYITDFPNEELLGVDGVIPVPHLGASTEEAEENCAQMAAAQLKEYLETGNIVNSVNFPAYASSHQGKRLCVAYKTGFDAENAIRKALEPHARFTLENVTRNAAGYAVALIQDGDPNPAIAEIKKIQGVTVVRVI